MYMPQGNKFYSAAAAILVATTIMFATAAPQPEVAVLSQAQQMLAANATSVDACAHTTAAACDASRA